MPTEPFNQYDRVRILEGTFKGIEGEVEGIDKAKQLITVLAKVPGFGDRLIPIDVEVKNLERVEQ